MIEPRDYAFQDKCTLQSFGIIEQALKGQDSQSPQKYIL